MIAPHVLEHSRHRIGPFLVSHLQIRMPNLPVAWQGFRMAQLTDFHYGPTTSAAHLWKLVDAVNGLRPDTLLLTGDYIHYSVTGFQHTLASRLNPPAFRWLDYRRRTRKLIQEFAEILSAFKVQGDIFATLGNHDHLEGAGSLVRLLPRRIQWLQNRSVTIIRDNHSLFISGVDDVNRGKPKLTEALSALNERNEHLLRLLLSHNPDITLDEHAALLAKVDFLLCGHTHGGQIRFPIVGALATRTRQKLHTQGMSQLANTTVYTSNGVGYGLLPVRLLCPPEIVLIELASAV